nr:hypothetical protein [uncultured bacterium]
MYPSLAAWPKLADPVARCDAFQYGAPNAGRRFLVIPARMLAAAGLSGRAAVFVSTFGDGALVTASSRHGGQRRALAGSSERGAVLQLTMSRLSSVLHRDSILLAGPGFVAVVSGSEAARYQHLPEFEKNEGLLKEETVAHVDAPLPARKGLLWRELTTAAYGRAQRCLDVTGNVWSVAGFELDSPLRVTRYMDGVLIERVAAEEANSQLRSKMARGKRAYGGKRFGRAVLSTIEGDTVRVVAMDGAIALVGVARSLRDFALIADDRRDYDTPATAEEALRVSPANTTVVPLDREVPNLIVTGAWLTNYGFHPGQRYSLEQDPVVRSRVLAVLDKEGAFLVGETPLNASHAALDLPLETVSHFRSPAVKVIGTRDGLHIQQHFAS